MEDKSKRRFFTQHAKSSAMAFSLIIHAILIVVAISYVAVTVIKKDDTQFEARQAARPKMELQKLQLPVTLKKKKVKPKLRKRILVTPRLNQTMPEIKLPEIAGVKGGTGSAGDTGMGSGIGFSLPEVNIFGLKSRGEKVFLILDCGPEMMADARGGIPAYTIIKNELLSIVDKLPPTTLFNISVYSKGRSEVLFPKMVSATQPNVEKTRTWLSPLNQFTVGMGDRDYGTQTLGPGGASTRESLALPPLHSSNYWLRSALIAMKQQADSIYVLTQGWDGLHYVTDTYEKGRNWSESDQQRWEAAVKKAKAKFAEENAQRRKKGLPPKVMSTTWAIVKYYVPGTRRPPGNKERHHYTPEEIDEGMKAVREKYAGKGGYDLRSGISKKKNRFSFNVIHFTTRQDNEPIDSFKKLTNDLRGQYLRIAGLDAIRFNASYSPEITGEATPPGE